MERVLNLAGKNSSEIFQLRYPFSLLTFCDYDLSYFAENAVAVCDEALRSGEPDTDRVTDLRNSLRNMHVFIEHNLRTVYDKVVLDCWIDYVCRRDNIGTPGLWNRFIDCKTPFEKAVFVRLCEYRYNKGINEWLNLVRVQDYAKNKVYFLFSKELSGVEEASARRNYFDLMFSVTARELGCRLEDLGVTQVFSAGRVPSAPFLYPSISKDIVKNVLTDFDYSDDYSDIGSYESMSDQIAMDAFSRMKASLPQELGSYNMSRPAMENAPGKIYMPCGLKAAVDLEIDALLESGGWLARCKRCGRYYVRDSEYTSDYCSLPGNGRTCLEIYEAEHPRTRVTPEMERQCREIMDYMYDRVTSGALSLKEYESWRSYLEAMKGKVNNGEIQPDDLTSFISYSKSMDISRSNPVVEVKKPAAEPHERVVKPFIPERISRSDISKPSEPAEVPEPVTDPSQRHEGFFTSPSVERQRSQVRTVSHIIRAERPQNEAQPYQGSFSDNASDKGFAVFGESSVDNSTGKSAAERGFTVFGESREITPDKPVNESVPAVSDTETEQTRNDPVFDNKFISFGESVERNTAQSAESKSPVFTATEQPQTVSEPESVTGSNETSETPKSAPKVIRKNAAAISAYGRIAGSNIRSESVFEAVSRPEPDNHENMVSGPSEDPFWEIGSIFDVLEQSENDMSRDHHLSASKSEFEVREEEPVHKRETGTPDVQQKRKPATKPHREPREVPEGIWTEDRHLFDDQTTTPHEELNMLKEKKRRSSKTQRLFDAIMKEPDDNPNFRKK